MEFHDPAVFVPFVISLSVVVVSEFVKFVRSGRKRAAHEESQRTESRLNIARKTEEISKVLNDRLMAEMRRLY